MAQTKKAQIRTTDRGGLARLILGCLFTMLGMGWALGLLMEAVYAWQTLRLLRDTANGLGGVLCILLPVFALWGGGLLFASARRRVSPRIYLSALGLYLCLLALITLTTYVGGRENPLMIYIGNNNKTALHMVNNTSYTAYLTGAYNLRGFNGGHLAGGGLLGMLIAYPLYGFLGQVGAVTLLILVMIALAFLLLWINPLDAISALGQRAAARGARRPAPEPEMQEAPQPVWPQPQGGGQRYPVEPLIPTQQVTYTGTSVQSDTEPSYLVQEEDLSRTPPMNAAANGFVPVQAGLYEEHIPVSDEPVLPPENTGRRRRGERAAQPQNGPVQPAAVQTAMPIPETITRPAAAAAQTPAEKPAEKPVDKTPVRQSVVPARKKEEEDLPWYGDDEKIPPIVEEKKETPAPKPQPAPVSRVSGGAHSSGEVQQVYTDPAVPLTGERISITGQRNDRPSLDPLAEKHTREAMKQATDAYVFPPMSLLSEPRQQHMDTTQEDDARARLLEHTLASFNIEARVEYVMHGPAITRFALRLAEGVNVNRLNTVSNNLAVSMKAIGLRMEIPIPGTSLVGIEVPNEKRSMVSLKEVLDSNIMRANTSPTAVALGKDITGQPILCDLSDMPHLLIAGATGSGKSVCINTIIQSILYRATPQQVRMIMIDPKVVELQPYNGIPHLLTEVVSEPKKAAAALDWLVQEMGDRYRRFQQTGVRNISGYNKKMVNPADHMPEIVAIIDEFSDLMVQCRKQVEESINRLAALARAAGIYMIVATQRPSVDVITGVIKANIPSRIAFAVATNTDSRTIIDAIGAEKLLGKGDMLYQPRSEFRPLRVQGCFVSDAEVQGVVDYVKANNSANYDQRIDEHMEKATAEEEQPPVGGKEPDYELQADTENELLQRAIEMAVESGQMSISMLRRRLGLGHSRAGKLIDTMASMGIVSQDEGPKPRRTLITREDYLKMQAEIMDQ